MKRIPPFLFAFIGIAAAHAAEAEVWVRAEHRGGEVVYHYEVRNRDAGRLDHFALGCDCRRPAQPALAAQLGVFPGATTLSGDDYLGQVLAVPPGAVTAPPGWRATLRVPPGERRYWIEWRTSDQAAAVPANQDLKGFSVALPMTDRGFLSGTFLLADTAGERVRNGQVRPSDTRPPHLSVQLHLRGAGNPEGSLSVATDVSVSDDIDPEPAVHLESFAREGLKEGESGAGRLSVTYRATDASGNVSRETAEIALPGALAGVVRLPEGGILP